MDYKWIERIVIKVFKPQTLLWLALVLALAGSLKHLAATFASVDGNEVMGWVQAIAIDAGLFALAYSIKVRKVSNRSVKPLWFGVIVFSSISVYGNLAYGLLSLEGSLPDWISVTRPYILAGSLPILVLFLAELLSDDRQYQVKQAAKIERKRASDKVVMPNDTVYLQKANDAKQVIIDTRRQQVLQMIEENMSQPAIANELGVSLATVKRDTKALNGSVK